MNNALADGELNNLPYRKTTVPLTPLTEVENSGYLKQCGGGILLKKL